MRKTSMRIDTDVPIEMRDGTITRADIYRPNDNGKYPVILTRTPYNKVLWKQSAYWDLTETLAAGYIRIVQDVRGRYASEGEYQRRSVFDVEVPDGYDSVEWIASQPWCDGNIGMIGASYMGNLQWITAMGKPPHLKAIAPDVATSGGVFDQTYFGGPTYVSFLAFWSLQMAMDMADKLEKKGENVSRMRKLLGQALAHPEIVYNYLPLKDVPHFKYPGMDEMWQNLLLNINPKADLGTAAFWPFERIKIPVLNVCGWFDISTWAAFNSFANMRERGGTEFARKNQYVYMGPWVHGGQTYDFLGEMVFGSKSPAPGLRVTPGSVLSSEAPISAVHMKFFNKYLRGIDEELAPINYFVMGENEWRTAEEWPLPGTQRQSFFLHSNGGANTAAGDGSLSRREPGSEPADNFVYNPHNPAPTTGGRHIQMGGVICGPRDQHHVAKRSDVLCYLSPELTQDLEVTGEVLLNLFAATSTIDTDFTAELVDVYPDGHAYNMADGIIRARHRNGYWKEELVTPGQVYEYKVHMGVTSHVFKKGHRIRVDISSSNFPAWDRNLNTGNAVGFDAKGIPAMQTIYHEKGNTSYLDLPVIARK